MAEASKDGAPSERQPVPGATKAPTSVGAADDYLELKAEPLRAVLTIKGAIAHAGLALTRDDVARKLRSQEVVNGVDWAAVDRMIAGKQYDRGQIIAQATPARPGRDAFIQEKIKIDSDLKPVLDDHGKADYKNVDNIHQVKKGDVLAVKVPADPGTEGRDIFGKAQPVQPGKDIQFKLGANTTVSANGLELQAAVSGFVYHQAGAVCVGVTYVLQGDVDFHTGNLHYLGDIQVLGNVTDGFTVEAEGNITVEGTVEGANVISRASGVTVKSGVYGHGKGLISAKTFVNVQSAQDIRIECPDGTVDVAMGLRNCQVTASAVNAAHPACSVVGGEIRAYGNVAIASLGGEGCHTHVRILDKDAEAAKARLKLIEHARAEVEAKLVPVETKLKGMKRMMERQGAVISERAKGELKAVVDAYTALKRAESGFDGEMERLNTVLACAPKRLGTFASTERIVWGGILEFSGHLRELEPGDAGKEWRWAPGEGGIVPGPLGAAEPINPATGKTDPSSGLPGPALSS
jgi:uncharacterized protein (DUF342 family)